MVGTGWNMHEALGHFVMLSNVYCLPSKAVKFGIQIMSDWPQQNGTNLGLFKISFEYILARNCTQNVH